MITKEITLAGKPVNLGYCFGTEIAYKDFADEDILSYVLHVIECLEKKEDPDKKRTLYAILACMLAYYEDADNAPIKDSDFLKEATPTEFINAVTAILELRAEFYHLPKGEPADSAPADSEKPKNA